MSSKDTDKEEEEERALYHQSQSFTQPSSPKDLFEGDPMDTSNENPLSDQSKSKSTHHVHSSSMMDNLLWNMPKRMYDWWWSSSTGEETIGVDAEEETIQELEEETSFSLGADQNQGPVFMELSLPSLEYDGQDMLASERLLSMLHEHLPPRWRAWEKRWKLIYSTARDGLSLSTLYSNVTVHSSSFKRKSTNERELFSNSGRSSDSYSSIGRHSSIPGGSGKRPLTRDLLLHQTRTRAISTAYSGGNYNSPNTNHNTPFLMIVKAHQDPNLLMGVMSMDPFQPTSSTYTHQYGNAECFLFTSNNNDDDNDDTLSVHVYPATGKNKGFLMGAKDWFAAGVSEGRFGLWLDGKLQRGCTSACATYDNPILLALNSNTTTKTVEFGIYGVEVWSLVI